MNMYTLTLTEQQLRMIEGALESVARMSLGQPEMCLQYAKDTEGVPLYDYSLTKQIEEIIKPKMGLLPNASWGVGAFPETDAMIDIRDVIRHRLSWDIAVKEGLTDGNKRVWSSMMGVCYDEPFHWNKKIPLPTISKC